MNSALHFTLRMMHKPNFSILTTTMSAENIRKCRDVVSSPVQPLPWRSVW